MKNTYIFSVVLLYSIYHNFLLSDALPDDYKLELLQVIFRHGDRTPDTREIYKTDPYVDLYKEYGYGQLTKVGMMREYRVGQMLRELYDSFLGEYRPEEVYAYSSEFDRTKVSLQLALAGLYPPTSKTTWNEKIQWTPIVTHQDPADTNFLSIKKGCCRYRYIPLLKEVEKMPEFQKKVEQYRDFFAHIENSTQILEATPLTIFLIQLNIQAILSMGLPLPDWCSKSDYKKLNEITSMAYDIMMYTKFLAKIGAGDMLEHFLNNIKASDSNDERKKIYLYSAHDINLAMLERAHKCTNVPAIPDYGSAIIIEKLRGSDGQVYVKMLLWTGVGEEILPFKIYGSSDPLPLSEYENLISWALPDDEVRECLAKVDRLRNAF